MVLGVVACVLAFAGDVSYGQGAWPLPALGDAALMRQTEGDSPRVCAAMADDER